jgi:hypothetical protein
LELGQNNFESLAVTPYHAKYFAYELTRRAASGLDERGSEKEVVR